MEFNDILDYSLYNVNHPIEIIRPEKGYNGNSNLHEGKEKEPLSMSPIFLQKGDQLKLPFFTHKTTVLSNIHHPHHQHHHQHHHHHPHPHSYHHPYKPSHHRRQSRAEMEKRDNHTVSEQKRRQAIRHRFQEMTDLVPYLKDKGCSKSGILFKAVDYIKHLETRNQRLTERLESLRIRAQVEEKKKNPTENALARFPSSLSPPGLPQSTLNALLLHQQQQKQLDELQYTLQTQLTRHQKSNLFYPLASASLIIPHGEDE
ncbi:hypothetical protein BY458DRAFT_525566 [Sporodiniella umbellata]|nr:hypothetical protein BY458DRAFT_525566 [Sporodiniella umbellata]